MSAADEYGRRYGVFRDFDYLCSGNNDEELSPLRLVSTIDPISGERTVTVYTDDGQGNGVGVLMLIDPGVFS
jgi:hypothetical protein